jgi:putative ABC transport system permease protein
MKTQIKLALKVLSRRKAFTAISLFGISMTLTVLMVAAAVLDAVVSPRDPETRSDRTLFVSRIGQYGENFGRTSDPGYGFLDQHMKTLPGIENATIFTNVQSAGIYRDGARIDTMLKRTDGAYWQILDFDFLEGGPYSAADDDSGAHVAVINEEMREKLFDGRPAVGRTIELEGGTFRVVGVVPRGTFTQMMSYSQVWVPIGTLKSSDYRRQMLGGFQGAVLVRDRSDIPALKREFESRLTRVPIDDPKQFQFTKAGLDTSFETLARAVIGNRLYDERSVLILIAVLAVLALLFMALPALNLITLNLSRILERSSEIGVRRAFGAPRSSLVRQFVFENIVMTVIGGALGFALAAAIIPLVNRVAPFPDANFALNLRVFAWGMALAVFFGIFSGVYPAWRMSRLHPVDALRGGVQ